MKSLTPAEKTFAGALQRETLPEMAPAELPLSVPDIGDAEKIELVTWNVRAGEHVETGQELCELVTDKAAFPLEAPRGGTVLEIKRAAGDLVAVGDTLLILQPDS